MRTNKGYRSKWIISYKGKNCAEVYGKKKAYELYINLSHCLLGLEVGPAQETKKEKLTADMKEYYRKWRARNKDKIKEYNRRSKLKRKLEQNGGVTEVAEEMNEAEEGNARSGHAPSEDGGYAGGMPPTARG